MMDILGEGFFIVYGYYSLLERDGYVNTAGTALEKSASVKARATTPNTHTRPGQDDNVYNESSQLLALLFPALGATFSLVTLELLRGFAGKVGYSIFCWRLIEVL